MHRVNPVHASSCTDRSSQSAGRLTEVSRREPVCGAPRMGTVTSVITESSDTFSVVQTSWTNRYSDWHRRYCSKRRGEVHSPDTLLKHRKPKGERLLVAIAG